jgi:formylmethanofuran dehydrogenase subunit C
MELKSRIGDTSEAAASRKFGRYKDFEESAQRRHVRAGSAVAALLEGFERIPQQLSARLDYERMLRVVSGITYSSKDVEEFAVIAARYSEKMPLGLFLSAAINVCADSDYTLELEGREPGHIGYRNTKNVTVIGSVFVNSGEEMESGTLHVRGNALGWIGERMSGGTITIDGDAGFCVGPWMEGGKIVINGKAGHNIGTKMKNGIIIVNGEIPTDYDAEDWHGLSAQARYLPGCGMSGGRIFHKGVLIAGK